MFFSLRPSEARLNAQLRACSTRAPNDPSLGVHLLQEPGAAFHLDAYGAELGEGEGTFRAGVRALRAWAMYPSPWCEVWAGPARWELDQNYLALIRHFGFWSVLPGRVIEVIDQHDTHVHRRGFTFMTLRGHAEAGVERFEVCWHQGDGRVEFCAKAASRPTGIARLASPLARHFQTRFHRESGPSMAAAVRAALRVG